MRLKARFEPGSVDILDFPAEGVTVTLQAEASVTKAICQVCDGLRKAVTHVFTYSAVDVLVGERRMTWDAFCAAHPVFAAAVTSQFVLGEPSRPTCRSCQADFFIPGRERYTGSAPDASGNEA